MMRRINRRQFLTLSATSAGTILLSQCALGKIQGNKKLPTSFKTLQNSQNGLLDLDLEASLKPITIGNTKASLMNYNGQIPAPRLEAKAGDTVRIRFTNNLSQPSNLHFHGLHISPTGKGDNPFLDIPSGESFAYEFTIPKNHPSGTFWYHPHRHHLVADQVFGGLAGLFIVRGELDEIPEIKAAKEEFLVFQDFGIDRNGNMINPNPMAQMLGREGQLITINGQVNPTLSMAKRGLLHLRLLNASTSRFYRLSLENHPFYLIATDGGSLAEPVELKELLLVPGERAQILIQGNQEAGQYRLLSLPYNRVGTGMMMNHGMNDDMMNDDMMMNHGMNGGMMNEEMMIESVTQTQPISLATLVYQGSTASISLPKKLLPIASLPEAKTVRRIEFSMQMNPGRGMIFLFNGKDFDPQRVDKKVALNSVEDWELVNVDPDKMEHPFHLHTNSFQVISRNEKPEPYLAWKDTILVRGDETVRIRIAFKDFVGKTVYHCHVLDHEDLGMMGVVKIA
jgi:FtsP/CotA-like multicopper oxidase with cupredoxin domain